MSVPASMLPTVTTLRDPLVKPLGKTAGEAFEKALGLRTAGDLLRHYPRRYYTRGELTPLDALREGDHVTVLAMVELVSRIGLSPDHRYNNPKVKKKWGQDRLEVIVTDGPGKLQLVFFASVGLHARQLRQGSIGLFAGTVSSFRGRRQLVHPEYEMLPDTNDTPLMTAEIAEQFANELIAVYPATAKLSSWRISRAVDAVLGTLEAGEDPIPAEVREKYDLWPRELAIRAIHRPQDRAELAHARKRLKWDEAFTMQAALAQRRLAAAARPSVPSPPIPDGLVAAFDRRLPFTLTQGQREVGEELAHDLACAYPMNRLLQGEVGSGKTVVAVRAMLQVGDAGGQATRGALLTGSSGVRARRSALTDAFTGDAGILIGTHALLEDRVRFADLGLAVIDEQHRFGVEQRDALRDKTLGSRPHVLVMTATPIPRTVAMTVFGDLEVSTLSELPAGRSPIASHVVPALERPRFLERAWQRVREEVESGRQAYVVCPRISSDP